MAVVHHHQQVWWWRPRWQWPSQPQAPPWWPWCSTCTCMMDDGCSTRTHTCTCMMTLRCSTHICTYTTCTTATTTSTSTSTSTSMTMMTTVIMTTMTARCPVIQCCQWWRWQWQWWWYIKQGYLRSFVPYIVSTSLNTVSWARECAAISFIAVVPLSPISIWMQTRCQQFTEAKLFSTAHGLR